MTFKILKSKWLYKGRVFDLRQDKVRLPNGVSALLDVVVHVGAVTILPVDSKGNIWLIQQYRHPAGIELLEIPAGMLEDGEGPEACAHREIQEEIGMAAGSLTKIGEYFLAPGYSTEFMHVFLAQDLVASPLDADEDEFLTVVKMPIHQVLLAAKTGKILDAKSLTALFLAQPYLEAFPQQ